MTETKEMYCIGCGSRIQTERANDRGYLPPSALKNKSEEDAIYCQRCFKLRHYNTLEKVQTTESEFLKILNQITTEQALVLNVVDIFDLSGSIISGIKRFAGTNDLVIVVNKFDLLPKGTNINRVQNWLQKYFKEQGVPTKSILIVSAKKKQNIDLLLDKINLLRKKKDVYFVGVTNVGKSTLINSIIQATGVPENLITTSQFPGTTLDRIVIPIEGGGSLIDTPGIIHSGQMTTLLEGKELQMAMPQQTIRPRTYQLNTKQTLFFGGLARLDYLKGRESKVGFTVYMSNQIKIHRRKLEGSDTFYEKHVGTLLTPPLQELHNDFPKLVQHLFTLKQASDIVISGLGWITVKEAVQIAVYVPEGSDVFIRECLI